MGDIVDIRQYLSTLSDNAELEQALMKSLDALPLTLSEEEKHEVYLYANELWTDIRNMETASKYTFTLEVACTDEQRERINTQINDCMHFLIDPRTKMINNLVAELIICKIREIQSRKLFTD
ncbi:hypothetical protein MAQ5080_00759 [Marinomonas aquimarina]|uniref:Uncharacterized protein n=1 Tax=Marinomonas aquimarina TaxID=295068 RepID=A0A1A8T4S1_9GAMM|nr:hypothetical protein [Marinomonas aquimarina]SBS27258.1 hypothetical protein MAQ5080_00759 [Marinomonas aquimarina]